MSLPPADRARQLVAQFLDGDLSPAEATELERLLDGDRSRAEQAVDALLLDSLLSETVGSESLTGLVDLVSDPPSAGAKPPAKALRFPRRAGLRAAVGGAAAVAALAFVFMLGPWGRPALADAATIVRGAMETHAQPVERIYIVHTERPATAEADFQAAREVRVATQGDRFYVEMNRDERRWFWGRDAAGAIWLTLGPRRALLVEPDEIGSPLHYIGDLYALELETILQNFLKHCVLSESFKTDSCHRIDVTPRYRWKRGWFKHAVVEVDRETKSIRKLVVERETPQHGTSTVVFTLVESRTPDESKYRPEGHLAAPVRLLTRDVQPDRRRETLTSWFGPSAERWIKIPEADRHDR
jgi:hypothetical protein